MRYNVQGGVSKRVMIVIKLGSKKVGVTRQQSVCEAEPTPTVSVELNEPMMRLSELD